MINVAIVKTSYTRNSGAAKATVRYNQNRRGKDGAKISRTLYSWDGKIERGEAYRMIDEAQRGSYFYRLIINPDPNKEDTNHDLYLWQVAEKTMRGLEERYGTSIQWVGATHADHTPLRHLHILAILPTKFDRSDLFAVREMATEAALDQRKERDNIIEHEKEPGKEKQWEQERERSK